MKIILGSASPRRQQLLRAIFDGVEVRVKNVDESFPAYLVADEIALYLAEHKAKAFDGELKADELLITADTIVWLNDHVLNKPADKAEALEMLKKLSGRCHQVFTGVCISTIKNKTCFSTESRVWFREIGEADLMQYIEKYKPFDKAGSYGAQECLPDKMNPLSIKEKRFLTRLNQKDLFEKSLAVKDHAKTPLIERIEGSYFNVMGLPIAELYKKIAKEIKAKI